MIRVRVVVLGRNYDAAAALPDRLELPDGASVDDALAALAGPLSAKGGLLPPTCLVAVSGTHLGTLACHRPHALREDDELLLLSPVAGG